MLSYEDGGWRLTYFIVKSPSQEWGMEYWNIGRMGEKL